MTTLSGRVKAFASEHGVTEEEFLSYVRQAAVCTNPFGNRRYHGWVFRIEQDTVVDVIDLRGQNVPLQPGEFIQYEECEECEGHGCPVCFYDGEVRYIRRV